MPPLVFVISPRMYLDSNKRSFTVHGGGGSLTLHICPKRRWICLASSCWTVPNLRLKKKKRHVSSHMTLSFVLQHLFPLVAAAQEDNLSLLKPSFQFLIRSILIYMISAHAHEHHTPRNKHTPTPRTAVRWAVTDLCSRLTSRLTSHSESLRPCGGTSRQWVTSPILLQEVFALSCTRAKSTICADGPSCVCDLIHHSHMILMKDCN